MRPTRKRGDGNRARLFEKSRDARRPSPCIKLTDFSTKYQPVGWLGGGGIADQEARLGTLFLEQNRGILRNLGIDARMEFDGRNVRLRLTSSHVIGAVPLLSPATGRPEYGIIVEPRFTWPGIGPVLGQAGWKILPNILPLAMLPRSARDVPPWVLSTVILARIEALLNSLQRRFEYVSVTTASPKGSVEWGKYASNQMGRGRFELVPCRFPELREDSELLGAAHFVLNRQLVSLEGQRVAGAVVLRLIDYCLALMHRVNSIPPVRPSSASFRKWQQVGLSTLPYREGVETLEWTIDERGLAGLLDFQGIPWLMSMNMFFEAWVETVFSRVAKETGATVRTGRHGQTVAPIAWEPPYLGSQKSLRPDLILDRPDCTIVVDAKYKEHWAEIASTRWRDVEDEIRERHREDLFQVLAYAHLTDKNRIKAVLAYPCNSGLWDDLSKRGQTYHIADVQAGRKSLRLITTCIPFGPEQTNEAQRILTPLLLA